MRSLWKSKSVKGERDIMSQIIYREIMENEIKLFAKKFGNYVIEYGCLHFGYGCYSLAAFHGEEPVGFISTYPETLIPPLEEQCDAYIDVIEVDKKYRGHGIARKMITMTEQWAKGYGYRQIRSWSSDDKEEAIPMWYALNYCVCPAIMYGEDLCPNEDGSKPTGYYVAKLLNPCAK